MFLTVMVLQLAQVQSCLQSYTIFLKCPFMCSLEWPRHTIKKNEL